jgi:hypothetical protein
VQGSTAASSTRDAHTLQRAPTSKLSKKKTNMATFRITDVLFLKSFDSLLLIGEIIDGTIRSGMTFNLKDYAFTVNGIESVDGQLNNQPISKIALKVAPNKKSLVEKHYQTPNVKS